MLDTYTSIARAVRQGDADDSVAQLNDRLRAVFEEFRIDHVDTEVVGVLPVLRGDLIARYREAGSAPVMTDYQDAIPTANLSDSRPAVLRGTDRPPAKPPAVL
jgi:hypothetical protein